MKFRLSIILLFVIVGLLFITLLCWQISYNNGFKRKFIKSVLNARKELFIKGNIGLACNTYSDIWIQQQSEKFTILKIGDSLSSQKRSEIQIPRQFDKGLNNYFYSQIDSTTFITNQHAEIVRMQNHVYNFYKIPNYKFDLSISTSPNTIFVRSFVYNPTHLQITKVKMTNEATIEKTYDIPKQLDGIFCSDGRLEYDKIHSRIYYMYYYRGEFICLDTNLNLIYKAKTIDTIHVANLAFLKYNKMKGKNLVPQKTLNSTSVQVNKYFSISNDKIYLYSALKADNQSTRDFVSYCTIDVYFAQNGKYLYSFNLPRINGRKVRQFFIRNNVFYGLYPNNLILYTLNE